MYFLFWQNLTCALYIIYFVFWQTLTGALCIIQYGCTRTTHHCSTIAGVRSGFVSGDSPDRDWLCYNDHVSWSGRQEQGSFSK